MYEQKQQTKKLYNSHFIFLNIYYDIYDAHFLMLLFTFQQNSPSGVTANQLSLILSHRWFGTDLYTRCPS